jgi:VanZ family protein
MKKHILTILIALNLALIWGNSLMNAQASGDLSGGILAMLGQFLPFLLTEAGHTLLRKAAHLSEFALLGLLYCGRHTLAHWKTPVHLMGFGLAVACMDETIQIFTPGRASSLMDVWIDTMGFALGFVVIYLAYKIKNNKGVQPI